MAKHIVVEERGQGIETQRTEIVERKGIGHPDSIADGIAERVSQRLCQEYLDTFGAVAHHNTDEVQIIGGKSQPQFNGGKVIQPAYFLLGGRATRSIGDDHVNVHGVAMDAAKTYLRENLRNLDVDRDVIIDSRIGEGSSDLVDVFDRDRAVPQANDTSFGIGHAPFSETEQLVLSVEQELNAPSTKSAHPFIGEDIKVMAYRDRDQINLTVATAFVDRYVSGVQDYNEKKARLGELVSEIAARKVDRNVSIALNTADGEAADSLYLTVTGTSAEMGDDGSVGRGNRVSGLITPKRAMSLEASSGKNPVSHIGKIYNIMAHRIAEQIVEETGVAEAHVSLLSQIGKPINEPQIADIQLVAAGGEIADAERSQANEITDHWLDNATEILHDIIEGKVRTF